MLPNSVKSVQNCTFLGFFRLLFPKLPIELRNSGGQSNQINLYPVRLKRSTRTVGGHEAFFKTKRVKFVF